MIIYSRLLLDKVLKAGGIKVLKDIAPSFLSTGHLILQLPDGSIEDLEYAR